MIIVPIIIHCGLFYFVTDQLDIYIFAALTKELNIFGIIQVQKLAVSFSLVRQVVMVGLLSFTVG